MVTFYPPADSDEQPLRVGSEYIAKGSWRLCTYDLQGRVLEVLAMADTAAGVAGASLSFLVQKDLAGWRVEFPED